MPTRRSERSQLDEQTEIALTEAMANRTVAVIATPPGGQQQSEALGSGVCLSYNGELFVLTAAHVVEGCGPGNVDFMARPNAPLTRDPSQLQLSDRFRPPISGIVSSPAAVDDLALLHLTTRPREMQHVDFYTVPINERPKLIRKQVGIFGFPFEISREVQRGRQHGRAVLPYYDFPPVARVTQSIIRLLMRADPPYRPSHHVLLSFPDLPIYSDHDRLHDPAGLSGGGAWKVSPRGPKDLWISSDVKPVAIITAYARRRGVLIATRIKRAWKLLRVWEQHSSGGLEAE